MPNAHPICLKCCVANFFTERNGLEKPVHQKNAFGTKSPYKSTSFHKFLVIFVRKICQMLIQFIWKFCTVNFFTQKIRSKKIVYKKNVFRTNSPTKVAIFTNFEDFLFGKYAKYLSNLSEILHSQCFHRKNTIGKDSLPKICF